jgi:hypothetical protein
VAGELRLPDLVQRLRLDTTGVKSGAGQVEGETQSLGRSMGTLKGTIVGAVGAFAAFEGVKVLRDVTGDAAKLNEQITTTNHLFGPEGSRSIIEFADTAASKLGLSKTAVLGMADSLGTMLRGFGLNTTASADMSTNLIKIANDVAAFKGADPAAVLKSFQLGLTGASRGLKTYGIDVSKTAQTEAALSLGIKGTAAEWTAAQKAAVFYQLILKGTAQESGAFAERSHNLAEEQRIFTAELANTKEEIGAALLPAVTGLFGALNKIFGILGPGGLKFVGTFVAGGIAAAVGAVAVIGFAKAVGALRDLFVSLGGASKVASAGMLEEAGAAGIATGAVEGLEGAEAGAAVESAGLFASMGPIGIIAAGVGLALGALTVVTGLFRHGNQDAGKSINDLIDQMLKEGATADDVANTLTSQYIASHKDVVDTLKKTGISVADVSKAVNGSGKAYDEIKRKLKAWEDSQVHATMTNQDWADGTIGSGNAAFKFSKKIHDLTSFIDKNKKSLQDQNSAFDRGKQASQQLADADQRAANEEDKLNTKIANTTQTMIDRLDQLRGQKEGLIGVTEASINLQKQTFDLAAAQATYQATLKETGPKAAEDQAKALLDLQLAQADFAKNTLEGVDTAEQWADSVSHVSDKAKTLADAEKAYNKEPTQENFKKRTAAANAYNTSVRAQIQGLQYAASITKGPLHAAILGDIADLEKQSGTVGANMVAEQHATTTRNAHVSALKREAAQLRGPSKAALQGYSDELAGMPPSKTTQFKTPGLPEATLHTHNYRGELSHIAPTKTTKFTLQDYEALHQIGILDRTLRAIPGVSQALIIHANIAQGGRAAGGPVEANRVYWVGEHGPELFSSAVPGQIIDNSSSMAAMRNLQRSRARQSSSSAVASPGAAAVGGPMVVNVYPQQAILREHELIRQMQRSERLGALHATGSRPRVRG